MRPYKAGRLAQDYPNAAFGLACQQIESLYDAILDEVLETNDDLQVFVHGYDWALPNGQRWLGEPLESIGIQDKDLQEALVKIVIDTLNEVLERAASKHARVHYVDCRGSVLEWHDELHPKSTSYALAADLIQERIEQVLGSDAR